LEAFAICEVGKNYSLQCEPHGNIILHFVLAGHGYLDCRFGKYKLGPGTVVIVPRMLRKHLAGAGPVLKVRQAEQSCVLRGQIVRFKAADRAGDLLIGCAELKPSVTRAVPMFDDFREPVVTRNRDSAIQSLFAALLKEVETPRAGSRAFLSALMKQLMILVLRADLDQNGPVMNAPSRKSQINRIGSVITNNPGRHYSIKLLAAEAGMSRGSFIKHFAEAFGCSPMSFVQSARLTSAAALLKNSDQPVKAVAATVGYSSRSQFSKAFRLQHGQSPSNFRRDSRVGACDRVRSDMRRPAYPLAPEKEQLLDGSESGHSFVGTT
jgi:AraC-like DNA-binding protein